MSNHGTRPVVSYEDIIPLEDSTPAQLGPPLPSASQPPAKKRKMHQKALQKRSPQHLQHWDDPGNDPDAVKYDDSSNCEAENIMEDEEESRELTHEEIWDDSALIEAWNSASAEYETYHGTDKQWKSEPVKKSPLWYNIPSDEPYLTKGKAIATSTDGVDEVQRENQDSTPLNFDTYVPTYDPSLASAIPPQPPSLPGPDYSQCYLPEPPGPPVTQDEAFTRALSAMYWGGYWTAVYHCRRREAQSDGECDMGSHEDHDRDDEVDEDLVDTQR